VIRAEHLVQPDGRAVRQVAVGLAVLRRIDTRKLCGKDRGALLDARGVAGGKQQKHVRRPVGAKQVLSS
jgi:hypothetical protein